MSRLTRNFNFLQNDTIDIKNKEEIVKQLLIVESNIKKRQNYIESAISAQTAGELIFKSYLEKTLNDDEYDDFKSLEFTKLIYGYKDMYGDYTSNMHQALMTIKRVRNLAAHPNKDEIGLKVTEIDLMESLKSIQYIIIVFFKDYFEEIPKILNFNHDIYFINSVSNQPINNDPTESKSSKENVNLKIKNDFAINSLTIKEWLSRDKSIIKIPIYQRGYEWEKENVQSLLIDIEKRLKDNTDHYFGVIASKIIKPDQVGDNYIIKIIDGQQRLTTSMLFYCAARDVLKYKFPNRNLKEDEEFSIINDACDKGIENYFYNPGGNEDFNQTFRNILLNKITKKDEKTKYYINYKLIYDWLLEKDSWVDIRDSYIILFNKFKLNTINFDPYSYSNKKEMELFENLNSKGKHLSVSDLMKNFLFCCCEEELLSEKENEIIVEFNKKFLNEKIKMNDFYSTLYSYMTGKEISTTRIVVFEQFKSAILKITGISENKKIAKFKDFEEILEKIERYFTPFYELQSYDASGNDFNLIRRLNIQNLIEIIGDKKKIALFIPFVYLVIDWLKKEDQNDWDVLANNFKYDIKNSQIKKISEIFLIVVKAIIRLQIIVGQGDSDLKRELYSISNKIREKIDSINSLEEIRLEIESSLKNYFKNKHTIEELEMSLNSSVEKTKPFTKLLLLVEHTMTPEEKILRKSKTLEHIMPKKPDKWISAINNVEEKEDFKNKHLAHLNKLGNLLILTSSKNSEASNLEFYLKKNKIYEGLITPLYDNKNIDIDIKQKEEWTFEDIEKRTKALIYYVLENIFTY